MSNNPLVSIIIPAYNAAERIEATLTSLLDNYYEDIEIIVVDDGSHDNTAALVREVMLHDARVSYYYTENGGPSAARNYGLSRAVGDYVMFVDADDRLMPHALETITGVFASYDCEMVSFDFETSSGSDRELVIETPFPTSGLRTSREFLDVLYSGKTGNFIWSYCFRRDLFSVRGNRFPPRINLMEDAVLINQIARMVESVYMLDEPLYIYTVNEHSLSHSLTLDKIREGVAALQLIEEMNASGTTDSAYHSYMFNMYMYLIWSLPNRLKNYGLGKQICDKLIKHAQFIDVNYKKRVKVSLLRLLYVL